MANGINIGNGGRCGKGFIPCRINVNVFAICWKKKVGLQEELQYYALVDSS
jgi:hypothetical protein